MQPQGARQVPQVREEPRPVGLGHHPSLLVGHEARGDEVLDLPGLVDGRNRAQPSARQRAGVVDDRAEDGSDIQATADAQGRPAQPGPALPQQLDLALQVVGTFSLHPHRLNAATPSRSMRPRERPVGDDNASASEMRYKSTCSSSY